MLEKTEYRTLYRSPDIVDMLFAKYLVRKAGFLWYMN
jgi:hypothetical protein